MQSLLATSHSASARSISCMSAHTQAGGWQLLQVDMPYAGQRGAMKLLRLAGNPNVLVCERGTMFGYSDLVVDPRNFVLMRDAACPITADVTHALQQPAGRALEVRTAGCCCHLENKVISRAGW